MKLKFTHRNVYIVVKLRGFSFIDMLRYDSCHPATEPESGVLSRVMEDGIQRWIILRRYVMVPPGDPTVERWSSFGCECYPKAFEHFAEAELMRDKLQKLPTVEASLALSISKL